MTIGIRERVARPSGLLNMGGGVMAPPSRPVPPPIQKKFKHFCLPLAKSFLHALRRILFLYKNKNGCKELGTYNEVPVLEKKKREIFSSSSF